MRRSTLFGFIAFLGLQHVEAREVLNMAKRAEACGCAWSVSSTFTQPEPSLVDTSLGVLGASTASTSTSASSQSAYPLIGRRFTNSSLPSSQSLVYPSTHATPTPGQTSARLCSLPRSSAAVSSAASSAVSSTSRRSSSTPTPGQASSRPAGGKCSLRPSSAVSSSAVPSASSRSSSTPIITSSTAKSSTPIVTLSGSLGVNPYVCEVICQSTPPTGTPTLINPYSVISQHSSTSTSTIIVTPTPTCGASELDAASASGAEQWAYAQVDSTWKKAIAYAQAAMSNETQVPTAEKWLWGVVEYLSGGNQTMAEQMDCLQFDTDTCQDIVDCSATEEPAGSLIINSLSQASQVLVGDWDALTAEGGLLPGLVSGIEADFTEFVDTSDALEVIEGIFEALGLLTLIPMLKAAFAGVDMIVTTVEEIKSPLLNLMSTATDWGNSWSDLSGLDTDLTLENAAGKILSSFMNNIDGINTMLFNGSDIDGLYSLINNGKLLAPAYQLYDIDSLVNGPIADSFMVALIALAWQESSKPLYPFLGMTTEPCDGKNPPSSLSKYFSSDVASATAMCADHDGEKYLYYLLEPGESMESGGVLGASATTYSMGKFKELPGLSSLGNGTYEGVSLIDIANAAYSTYVASGYTNNGSRIDATNPTDIENVWNDNFTAPGVVNIPVCNVTDAISNIVEYYTNGIKSTYYPC